MAVHPCNQCRTTRGATFPALGTWWCLTCGHWLTMRQTPVAIHPDPDAPAGTYRDET